jgi:hypothetical protein
MGQARPLSPLLFSIEVEVLVRAVRQVERKLSLFISVIVLYLESCPPKKEKKETPN